MSEELKSTNGPLEQFILLAKNTKGPALIALINQLLEAPGVYVFGEFLNLSCVEELSKGPNQGYFQLLNLFAYGSYVDYTANKDTLPVLSDAQKIKLKHLTIVHLAEKMQCIPYSVLMRDLEMPTVRALEDLIIDAVYTDVIRGKLDQCRQLLEVDDCIGRDIQERDIGSITNTLSQWCVGEFNVILKQQCAGCESVSSAIELQVNRVTECRATHLKTQQQLEAEVAEIKTTLKAAAAPSSQEADPHVMEQEDEPSGERQPCLKMITKVKEFLNIRH
ncbi:COP9 signalosome complex subunit 7b isoform X2 [Amia ocellicauda]|uniref:COP9 signalosome complex subunit 7b isoform X2 n=1 Tax=Amia ocellicauda TaxID=2972642 RepID=UPI0034639986